MKPISVKRIERQVRELGNEEIAEHSQRFFKTGKGEYGEGDQFVGVRMPVIRKLAKEHRELPLSAVEQLLHSPIHEIRILSLLILVLQFQKGDDAAKKAVFDCYCRNMKWVNNWDLVDCSAHLIVGPYLQERSKRKLDQWARSKNLWYRRIAVMSTFAYIKNGEFDETLRLAEMLVDDPEDLIHKIVGWMLREIGNRDRKVEEVFLDKHHKKMPRTMLRYAIEKFTPARRKHYMQ